jgi:hypothetical protein
MNTNEGYFNQSVGCGLPHRFYQMSAVIGAASRTLRLNRKAARYFIRVILPTIFRNGFFTTPN